MTQLRCDPNSLTNYFDRLLHGIGHRGSSFMNVDRLDAAPLVVTHCGQTHRFLFQEFKQEDEPATRGQEWALCDLALQPAHTVWLVIKRRDGLVDWLDLKQSSDASEYDTISTDEYCARFRRWWNNQPVTILRVADGSMSADDIPW